MQNLKIDYLVQIEFSYKKIKNSEDYCVNDFVTIGVFNSEDEAIIKANKTLEELEKRFKLNPNYNRKKRFRRGGFYIISNLGYIQTPFAFSITIKPLKYKSINNELDLMLKEIKEYKNFIKEQEAIH